MVKEKAATTMDRSTKTGIRNLDTFSMPFSTPNSTTTAVSSTYRMNQNSGVANRPLPTKPIKLPK